MSTFRSLSEAASETLEVCGFTFDSDYALLAAFRKGVIWGISRLPSISITMLAINAPEPHDRRYFQPYQMSTAPDEVKAVAAEWIAVMGREMELLRAAGKKLALNGAEALIADKQYGVLADLCDDLGLHFLADQTLRRQAPLDTPPFVSVFRSPAVLGAQLIEYFLVPVGGPS